LNLRADLLRKSSLQSRNNQGIVVQASRLLCSSVNGQARRLHTIGGEMAARQSLGQEKFPLPYETQTAA
jgi:hypothetical protein